MCEMILKIWSMKVNRSPFLNGQISLVFTSVSQTLKCIRRRLVAICSILGKHDICIEQANCFHLNLIENVWGTLTLAIYPNGKPYSSVKDLKYVIGNNSFCQKKYKTWFYRLIILLFKLTKHHKVSNNQELTFVIIL